jgi:hypothetical protein
MTAEGFAITMLVLVVVIAASASIVGAQIEDFALVHGAFSDEAGMKPVADILEWDGYCVQSY